jgi:hypothetical protein
MWRRTWARNGVAPILQVFGPQAPSLQRLIQWYRRHPRPMDASPKSSYSPPIWSARDGNKDRAADTTTSRIAATQRGADHDHHRDRTAAAHPALAARDRPASPALTWRSADLCYDSRHSRMARHCSAASRPHLHLSSVGARPRQRLGWRPGRGGSNVSAHAFHSGDRRAEHEVPGRASLGEGSGGRPSQGIPAAGSGSGAVHDHGQHLPVDVSGV